METSYSYLKDKARRNRHSYEQYKLSTSLTDDPSLLVTRDQLIQAFCNDLRELLGFDNIADIVEGIFLVESNLVKVISNFSMREKDELPSLNGLFQRLSPILLRTLWDKGRLDDNIAQDVANEWKEAIRVTIEEEYYHWHDKIL